MRFETNREGFRKMYVCMICKPYRRFNFKEDIEKHAEETHYKLQTHEKDDQSPETPPGVLP